VDILDRIDNLCLMGRMEVFSMSNEAYNIELEVFEGKCSRHRKGEKFKYPDDRGKICFLLLDSANGMIRTLQYGGILPWTYSGTPYEKQIDPDGVTTEFVRCPDPTSSGVVLKITRTCKKPEPTNRKRK
jgi:uncharacterized repeat protein (TIGR04076 family)